MRVGCLFGSFDPPHRGHVAIADHVLQAGRFDRIWLVVTPCNPFKQGQDITDDVHRLAMVRLAIAGHHGLEASGIEVGLPPPNYTVDTLAAMRERWPEHDFSLVMGSDNLAGLHRWKDHETILAKHEVWVYPRPGWAGHLAEARHTQHQAVHLLPEAPLMDISATEVRSLVRAGMDTGSMLHPAVADYIRQHRLYTD